MKEDDRHFLLKHRIKYDTIQESEYFIWHDTIQWCHEITKQNAKLSGVSAAVISIGDLPVGAGVAVATPDKEETCLPGTRM